jgi:hypothetical protein
MQYVGNAAIDDAGNQVSGVALTSDPYGLTYFLDYAQEEIDQPWVKIVGEALEPYGETNPEVEWLGAFVPIQGDLDDPDNAPGRTLTLTIWDDAHPAAVIERITLSNGRGFYILKADGLKADGTE